jgi:Fe-S-cluster containining protein
MPHSTGLAVLPPLYAAWMDELLEDAIPPERAATCHDCAMCAPAGEEPTPGTLYFRPDVKCCSFMPELWNFLVGRVLADQSPEGRAGRLSVEARIAAGVAVTPLGLGMTPTYQVLYNNMGNAFGRSRGMICPHFQAGTGNCTIWRHRESTCSTYFCKHERGANGAAFWHSLQMLLHSAETALAKHAVLELNPGPEALKTLFMPRRPEEKGLSTEDLDATVSPAVASLRWGTWVGREREFYRQAAGVIEPLRWKDVVRIGGSQLRVHVALTREAFERLRSSRLPGRLIPGSVHVMAYSAERTLVTGYSGLDPLALRPELLEVLHYFDGRPTSAVLRDIAAERGIRLTTSLIRQLVDFGILAAQE